MNVLFSTKTNSAATNVVLLLTRIFVGIAMLTHGFPKLQKLVSGEPIEFFDFIGFGPKFSIGMAVFAEVICSVFLILGLFSRWAAFFLAFTMAVATLVVHAADPFTTKELGFVYLAIYLLLLVFGPGRFSIDSLISQRTERSRW